MGFFDKLKNGLSKTKNSFDEKINNVFSNFRKVDEELLDELEEALIMSDVGVETSTKIISNLRNRIKKEKIENEEDVRNALREEIVNILNEVDNGLKLNTHPSVILVVGVNGVGKTTSIGKIANRLKKDGKKVVVAAADTFRAAAVEQLEIWANRAGADIVKRKEGVDPASVVYEAIKITKKKDADVLIVDTAGRLHNKKYLMDELNKIQKVINKEMQEADKEVLLVIDGTTGQNAISQVKAFKEEADLTGLVITKLDGTAKGGVVIGIVAENKIPVKFIGVGEQIDDMEKFYRSIDVLVAPSIVKESFGLVLCEAIYCGLPVIATNSGAQREIITQKQYGTVVDNLNADSLAEAISETYKNKERNGSKGEIYISRNFNIEITAKKLIEVYEHLLKK